MLILKSAGAKHGSLNVGAECTAVAAIQLQMRMRILTHPENSLANLIHLISKQKLRNKRCEGIR